MSMIIALFASFSIGCLGWLLLSAIAWLTGEDSFASATFRPAVALIISISLFVFFAVLESSDTKCKCTEIEANEEAE
ncbi:hypothetical protein J6Z39_09095 [bacterium]|nr:hypothetical protein [bacterium]MBP5435959.1 hypothetical protein [bacterium]